MASAAECLSVSNSQGKKLVRHQQGAWCSGKHGRRHRRSHRGCAM